MLKSPILEVTKSANKSAKSPILAVIVLPEIASAKILDADSIALFARLRFCDAKWSPSESALAKDADKLGKSTIETLPKEPVEIAEPLMFPPDRDWETKS